MSWVPAACGIGFSFWILSQDRKREREAIAAEVDRDIEEAAKLTGDNRESLHMVARDLRSTLLKCDRIRDSHRREQISQRFDRINEQIGILNRIETLRETLAPLSRTPSGQNVENMRDLPDNPADWPGFILWPMVPAHKIDAYLRHFGIKDERVLAAVREIRLCGFRPWEMQIAPLWMTGVTERLQIGNNDTILHVGTGTGVEPALYSKLARSVVTIEINSIFAGMARANLERSGCGNVTLITGDGRSGHASRAPFDVIALSGAVGSVPPELWNQLRNGGRMAIPISSADEQELWFIRKTEDHPEISFHTRCRFDELR